LDLEEAVTFETLTMIDANETVPSTEPQQCTRRPMEPHMSLARPGAYRVAGPGHHESGSLTLESYGVPEDATTYDDPDKPNADDPIVAAGHFADTQEEERRIRELEAQNKMLREHEQNIVEARVVRKSEILKSFFNLRDPEFRRQQLCTFGFVMLALSAIVIGVVLTKDRRVPGAPPTKAFTMAPTPEPTSEGLGDLTIFLSDFASFDGGASVTNQSTPQYKAAKWLADNNTRLEEYSDKQKIQRYVLATLYFSTNGDSWKTNTDWLEDNDECGRWFQSPGIGSRLYFPK
jgi:hypothetical protein